MTRIPTTIPIVQIFDFIYFSGFIWLFHTSTITIIILIQAESLHSMLISQHHSYRIKILIRNYYQIHNSIF